MENGNSLLKGGYFHDYLKKHGTADGALGLPPPSSLGSATRAPLGAAAVANGPGGSSTRHAHRLAGESITDRAAYVSFLETQLERISSKVLQTDSLQETVDVQAKQIADLSEKVAALTKLISLTQTYTEQQGKEAGSAVAELQASVLALQQRDDEIATRVSSIETWGETVDENVGALHKLAERHMHAETRLQAVEHQSGQLVDAVTDLQKHSATKEALAKVEQIAQDAAEEAERSALAAEDTLRSSESMLAAAERARDGAVSAEASSLKALDLAAAAEKEISAGIKIAGEASAAAIESANRADIATAAAKAALKAAADILDGAATAAASAASANGSAEGGASSSQLGSRTGEARQDSSSNSPDVLVNANAEAVRSALLPLFASFFDEVKANLSSLVARCESQDGDIARLRADVDLAEERRGASISAAEERSQSRADGLAAELDAVRQALQARLEESLEGLTSSLQARIKQEVQEAQMQMETMLSEEAKRLEADGENGLEETKRRLEEETKRVEAQAGNRIEEQAGRLASVICEKLQSLSAEISARVEREVADLQRSMAAMQQQAKGEVEGLSTALESKLQLSAGALQTVQGRLDSSEDALKRLAWLIGPEVSRQVEVKAEADAEAAALSSLLFPHLRASISELVDASVSSAASDALAQRTGDEKALTASATATVNAAVATAKEAADRATAAAEAAITAFNGDKAKMSASIDALASSLAALRRDFDKHCEEQAAEEGDLSSGLEGLRQELATLQQQVAAADTEQQQLIRAADGLVTRWNGAHESITELRDTLSSLTSEVSTLRMLVEAIAARPVTREAPATPAPPPQPLVKENTLPMRVASFRAGVSTTLNRGKESKDGGVGAGPARASVPEGDEGEEERDEDEAAVDGEDRGAEGNEDLDVNQSLHHTARTLASTATAKSQAAAASSVSPKEVLRILDTMVQPRMQSIASELHSRLSAEVATIAMRAGLAAAQAQVQAQLQHQQQQQQAATAAEGGAPATTIPRLALEPSPAVPSGGGIRSRRSSAVADAAAAPPLPPSAPATSRDSRSTVTFAAQPPVPPLPLATVRAHEERVHQGEKEAAAVVSLPASSCLPIHPPPIVLTVDTTEAPLPALPASLPASARNSIASATMTPSAPVFTGRGRQPRDTMAPPPLPLPLPTSSFPDSSVTARTATVNAVAEPPSSPKSQPVNRSRRSTGASSHHSLLLQMQAGGVDIKSGADLTDWIEGGARGLAMSPTRIAEAATEEAIRRRLEREQQRQEEDEGEDQNRLKEESEDEEGAEEKEQRDTVRETLNVVPLDANADAAARNSLSATGTRLERELLTSRTGSSASAASAAGGNVVAVTDPKASPATITQPPLSLVTDRPAHPPAAAVAASAFPMDQGAGAPEVAAFPGGKKPRPTNSSGRTRGGAEPRLPLPPSAASRSSSPGAGLPRYDDVDNAPPEDALLDEDGSAEDEDELVFGSASARATPTQHLQEKEKLAAAKAALSSRSPKGVAAGASKSLPTLQQLAFPDTSVAAAGYAFGPQGTAAPLPIVMTASGTPAVGIPVSRRNERAVVPGQHQHQHQHQHQKRNAAVGVGIFGRENTLAKVHGNGHGNGHGSAGSSRRSSLASSVDFGSHRGGSPRGKGGLGDTGGGGGGTMPAPPGVDVGRLYGGRYERPHPGMAPPAAAVGVVAANPDDIVNGDEHHTARSRHKAAAAAAAAGGGGGGGATTGRSGSSGPTMHAGHGVLAHAGHAAVGPGSGGSGGILISTSSPQMVAGMGMMAAMLAAAPPSPKRPGSAAGLSSGRRSTSRGTFSGRGGSSPSAGGAADASNAGGRRSRGAGSVGAGSASGRGNGNNPAAAAAATAGADGSSASLGKLPAWYSKRAEQLGQQTAKAANEINATMGVGVGMGVGGGGAAARPIPSRGRKVTSDSEELLLS